MNEQQTMSGYGFSPPISAVLAVNGEEFALASLCDRYVVVRDAKSVGPGSGTVRLNVGEELTIYHIKLLDGIDPARHDQPIELVRVVEEAVA